MPSGGALLRQSRQRRLDRNPKMNHKWTHLRSGIARAALRLTLLLVAFALSGGIALAAVNATGLIDLGTASNFAVLGGQSVTNTGATVITGNIGVAPGTAITGFPP